LGASPFNYDGYRRTLALQSNEANDDDDAGDDGQFESHIFIGSDSVAEYPDRSESPTDSLNSAATEPSNWTVK
jgi:hypothetical protein